MKATISLEAILNLINKFSLSASNKRWIAEKLMEEAQKEEAEAVHVSASNFYGIWKDEDYPDLSSDEKAKETRSNRKFKNLQVSTILQNRKTAAASETAV